ncbi:protein PML-like [Dendronephthya gigantea]|uniref:protein PML-like n=1 Tax=Dendronephthya gigantea TaxID=151771 RepID=UPI00106A2450|nr:protein PML-like [Dendronephthya gigantea]
MELWGNDAVSLCSLPTVTVRYVERLRGEDQNIEIFPCPRCRSEFMLKTSKDISGMASNCFIKNMLENLTIQQKAKASAACSRCQEPAINHCATCEVFLCKKCSDSHDSWLVPMKQSSHDVLSMQELINSESEVRIKRKLYCMKHEGEMLKYYCETCRELCCIHCVVLNHQKPEHSCMAVSGDAQKQRETLQSSSTILDEKVSEGKGALKNVCEVMKALKKIAESAKDQIEEQKQKILKIITDELCERAKKMNEEVDKFYKELYSELSEQHDGIKDFLDKVQASVSLPRNLLKRGSVEEILSLQKEIDENIEKLISEQPKDMTPLNHGGIRFVPGDIGDINVDELVSIMGHIEADPVSLNPNLRASSNILSGEISLTKQLQQWLGEKCKWNLCYRASKDGWSAQDFHRHCDNKGPTVVLVKANNFIFGGYTDQNWLGITGNRYCQSTSSFLFSLRNKDNLAPFIANIKQGQERYAIYCSRAYGPVFGGGHDLFIHDKPQLNQSSAGNFGHTYQLPAGYVYASSEEAMNLLAGQPFFHTTEIEVFN